MNKQESDEFLNLISHEFEMLGKKLSTRGLLANEWEKALLPLDASLADHVLRRWVRKHNTEPTLDRFMDLVEEIQEESRRRYSAASSKFIKASQPVVEIMSVAAQQQRTAQDKLWAKLHIQLVQRILGKPQVERDHSMIDHYERWRQEYPHFSTDCEQAIIEVAGEVPF